MRFRASFEGKVLYDRTPLRIGQEKRFSTACSEIPFNGLGTLELGGELVHGSAEILPSDADEPAWLSVASLRIVHPEHARRRVLVWISQDSLRADHLQSYGYARDTAPVFARFASEAAVFDAAYSAASWTLPSLTSQFTSRYPSFHSLASEFGERLRDPSEPDIFDVLRQQGFTVLGVTANRFVSPEFQLASGFDALTFTGDTSIAADVNRAVLKLLEEWHGENLALFVHYFDPHFPYEPPAPFNSLFDLKYRGRATGRNFEQFTRGQPEEVAHVKALYDGEIAYTDREIGELLEELDHRGLLENAVVAYSADHGEEFLDHGGWTHGRTLYNELLHIPLAIRLPRRAPRRIPQVVSGVDIAPTLLEALEIPRPPGFQGRSLLPLIGGSTLTQVPVFAETSHGADRHLRVAVQDANYKYVLVSKDEHGPPLREQLYDLRADPQEVHALSASKELPRLRRLVRLFLSDAPSGGTTVRVPEDTRRSLEGLGYVN